MPKFVNLPQYKSHLVVVNFPGAKCGKGKFTESQYSLKFWLVKLLASKSQIFALNLRPALVAPFLQNVESAGS
ncbi:hypothetical protein CGK63_00540 [Vibrio parahaemolyticus]|nr:hypothetical protein D5E73_23585 [Vibrio parahaemolyticus]TBT71380.1 hypothetical protein D5E72_24150 [Vibrio parahaemolyticus]TNY80714.1 hypothetical protein CGK63_00540 [Vibrio parahaemolyticus]TOG28218.1 hypothetical protein CGJ04_23275 [Vibrio parahaemolyticus]TOK95150.1 hypothetical protein CGI06_23745 [Vibrio parahaemolyticus]